MLNLLIRISRQAGGFAGRAQHSHLEVIQTEDASSSLLTSGLHPRLTDGVTGSNGHPAGGTADVVAGRDTAIALLGVADVDNDRPLALILENEPLILLDLEAILHDAGMRCAAYTIAASMPPFDSLGPVALALLDTQLGALALADDLRARGVPVVIITPVQDRQDGVRFLRKPYSTEDLRALVTDLVTVQYQEQLRRS